MTSLSPLSTTQSKAKQDKQADNMSRLMSDMKVSVDGESRKPSALDSMLAVGSDESDSSDDGEVIDKSEQPSPSFRL